MNDKEIRARNLVRAAVALALAGATGNALADSPAPDASGKTLAEVVVTATKRSENIEHVGASVSALGEADLARSGVGDVSRLENSVPGLQFGQSGNEVRLAMRGTRTNNVGSEAEQVVGIYEDGVYVPTTTQALGSYVDVKRVEVLRGPQGTLYGRNTFGGAINVISNEPTFDSMHGDVLGLYGAYSRVRLEGTVNLPIDSTWAVRLVGMTDKHDGYIKNTSPGVADLNDDNVKYGRATIRWKPSESFDASLRVNFMQRNSTGSAIWGYQQIGTYIGGVYSPGNLWAPPDASNHFDQGPWKVARNMPSLDDNRSLGVSLDLSWDVGFATVHYIGNKTNFSGKQAYDPDYSDGGSATDNGFVGWTSKQDSYSHELQMLSNGQTALKWIVGLYYFKQDATWSWLERTNGVLDVPYWDNPGDYISESSAIFGQATYSLTDKLRVIAGLRYQEDKKRNRDNLDWSTFPPTDVPGSGSRGSWNKMLWKAGLEYDVAAKTLAYATVSTGYRSGGINFVAPSVPLTYAPESVTAYEVGWKTTSSDGRVVLNLAAYVNQYRDMQAQSFVNLSGAGGVSEFTESGGAITAKGIEAELKWLPTDNWQVSGSLALMDATFGDYNIAKIPGLGDLGGRQNLSDPSQPLLSLKGWNPALSPKLTASLQASYDISLPGGSRLTPLVQASYTSEYSAADVNVQGQFMKAHAITDLRLMWADAGGTWDVQAFVLNAGNEAVLNRVVVFNPNAGQDLASLQANWGAPRTWGISVSKKF